MAALNEPDEFNDTAVEVAHEFAVDLNSLVVTNHRFSIEGIARAEDEEMANWQGAVAQEDWEVSSSVLQHERGKFDALRQAANHLALVGIVTRLQHWVGRFVERQGRKPKKHTRLDGSGESRLISQLRGLNESLGDGPVPISDFEKLVDVRDSIIHADAQAGWKNDQGRERKIADEYRSACHVELSEDQVKNAVEKAIRQVAWYDKKLQPSPSQG